MLLMAGIHVTGQPVNGLLVDAEYLLQGGDIGVGQVLQSVGDDGTQGRCVSSQVFIDGLMDTGLELFRVFRHFGGRCRGCGTGTYFLVQLFELLI